MSRRSPSRARASRSTPWTKSAAVSIPSRRFSGASLCARRATATAPAIAGPGWRRRHATRGRPPPRSTDACLPRRKTQRASAAPSGRRGNVTDDRSRRGCRRSSASTRCPRPRSSGRETRGRSSRKRKRRRALPPPASADASSLSSTPKPCRCHLRRRAKARPGLL